MPRLAELQQTMHRLLRGEIAVEEAAAILGADPARLAIYAGFVRDHVRHMLEKNYGYLRRLLPGELWETLCAAYFETRPPDHWEVNRAAEAFPDFLEQQLDTHPALAPQHVVLARFEWEQFDAHMHPAEIPDPAELGHAILNPTLSVLELPYDLFDLLTRPDLTPDTPLPPPDPTIALLYRDPGDQTARAERATDELLLALKITADRIPIPDAARATGRTEAEIEASLADASERGVVLSR